MTKKEGKYIEGKVILLGDSSVGKTNLINVCIGEKFNPNPNCTISASYVDKIIEIENMKFKIHLWDTAGSEKYKGLTKIFYKGSDIVIFVYDITEDESFKNLDSWINEAKEIIDNKFVFGIVGNKNDLFKNAKVTEKEGMEYAKLKKAKFKLLSAKEEPEKFNDFIIDLIKEEKKILINKKNNISLKKTKKKKKNDGCC